MNEYVWPAVIAFAAVLAFLRFRPQPSAVRLRRVKKLEARVKELEVDRASVAAQLEVRSKAYADEVAIIKQQASDRLNDFAQDLTLLKQEFSSLRTRAGLKAIVEQKAG